jgi:hypothetical protein
MREMEKVLKMRIVVPKDLTSTEFSIDELRTMTEEYVEKITRATLRIDGSALCEPASTQIYRTTSACANRVDFCLGRLLGRRRGNQHIHAKEEYGWNLNECWLAIDVYTEGVSETAGG